MSISIVIVTNNSSEKIEVLLKSILEQDEKIKLQIIIIDNNSSDQKQLSEVLSKYKYLDLKIIYRKINDGFGRSCNYGAKFAKYSRILFLNPDTRLLVGSLSTLIDHMIIHSANVVGGKSIHINSNEIHRTVYKTPDINTMLFEFCNLGKIFKKNNTFYLDQNKIVTDLLVDGIGGAYLMIEKAAFRKLGGFDKNIFMYLEDVDLCLRANQAGLKVLYCPHSIIRHIGGASSNNRHRINHQAWYESREYYADKYFPKLLSGFIIVVYKLEKLLLTIRSKYSK